MQMPFETIWRKYPEDIYKNNLKIRVNGITAEKGVFKWKIGQNVLVGGINWELFLGHDIEVTFDEDTMVIKGIY